MAIKVNCRECKNEIEFPDTSNASEDKWEHLAFSIYSIFANDENRTCFNCELKNKRIQRSIWKRI